MPTSRCRTGRRQRGGFLLEALIGILIFTLGVLGLVALQARAIGYTNDAQYRGEAAYLANAYVSKMWADNRTNLPLRYIASGQPEFDALQQAVFERLPGASAIANNPTVQVWQPAAGAATTDARGDGSSPITLTSSGSLVTITIMWAQPALEGSGSVQHNYTMTSIIAHN